MKPRLFGIETEMAVAAARADGSPLCLDTVLQAFMETAQRSFRHLPDERCGMFLENGARFYRDSAGSADHLEYATPETVNPWDAVRYVQAGEELMLDLAERIRKARPEVGSVRVMKHNANYGRKRGATWGTHESYLHQCPVDRIHRHLIPFLVSRIVITGAGGFDPLSAGVKFLLSPRVAHLTREMSGDTTHDRPIYNTKNETLCGDGAAWGRLHLVCGESNCSETSLWLKMATTALVVAMIEANVPAGDGVSLLRPLEAMKRFAADPQMKRSSKPSAGGLLKAVQIQRHYLNYAEANRNQDFMPGWAGEACDLWRRTLDDLERGGAPAVAGRLDWATKYALFGQHLERRGFSWEEADRLTRLAGRLQRDQERHEFGASGMGDVYLEPRHLLDPCPAIREHLRADDRVRLIQFLQTRDELFELDLRFMTVGPAGLFRQLEQAGVLQHHVPGVERIDDARISPPEGSRAFRRGLAVKELAGSPHGGAALCMWNMIRTAERSLDLRDPFATAVEWKKAARENSDALYQEGLFRHARMFRQMMAEMRCESRASAAEASQASAPAAEGGPAGE